jgi:D-alanyl-D-alanine carboxypeptidase
VAPLIVALVFIASVAIFTRGRAVTDPVMVMGYVRGVPFQLAIEKVDGLWMSLPVAQAWRAMKADAVQVGVRLRANSAFRTMEEQVALYNMSPEEREKRGVGKQVARPGYSNHQSGKAIDVSVARPDSKAWVLAHAARFGFAHTLPDEPWHLELIT